MRNPTQAKINDVEVSVENAMAYTKQAISVLDMWLDYLRKDDDEEGQRVSAVFTLVNEALAQLIKAKEQSDA